MSVSEFAYEIDEAAGIVRFYGDGKYTHETTLGPYASWTEFRTTYLNAGWIDRIPSLPADATEQAEIDAAKCQPAHVSHVEPERKPLDWNKSTPFDSFGPGFVVTSGANPGWDTFQGLQGGHSHPLQRMNEGGNALCGSAALLQDRKVR
jgi:hypothetical protein